MSFVKNKIKSIQKTSKHIAALGSWIASIAGAIFIPLPEWGDNDQYYSQIKFILFISTVVAGLSIIMTYKLKKKQLWLFLSISVFIALIVSYNAYNHNINKRTLKYYDSTIVIGNELKDPENFQTKKEKFKLDKEDLLKAVAGVPAKIWTEQSISRNKNILIFFLSLNYCLFAIFLVSFTNTITLYTSKNV